MVTIRKIASVFIFGLGALLALAVLITGDIGVIPIVFLLGVVGYALWPRRKDEGKAQPQPSDTSEQPSDPTDDKAFPEPELSQIRLKRGISDKRIAKLIEDADMPVSEPVRIALTVAYDASYAAIGIIPIWYNPSKLYFIFTDEYLFVGHGRMFKVKFIRRIPVCAINEIVLEKRRLGHSKLRLVFDDGVVQWSANFKAARKLSTALHDWIPMRMGTKKELKKSIG